jgi:outer membrane biosynthesis protein TonB
MNLAFLRFREDLPVHSAAMSGLAYFFKPKINPTDSNTSGATTEKRSGRRSKSTKPAEIVEKPPAPVETVEPVPEVTPEPEVTPVPEVNPVPEEQPENLPSTTPKIKLKFNLRSQSVQDTSDDRAFTTTNVKH